METRTGIRPPRRRLTRLIPEPGTSRVAGAADDLNRGILTTEISPGLARVITAAFVTALLALPIAQAALELRREGRIQAFDVFRRVPTKANLSAFETALTRQSYARETVRPGLQRALSERLGFGTATAIVGLDGWLFYRPGIDWVTGGGFLDPARLARRRKELEDNGETLGSPDPRPAIRAFHEDCRKAGVHLVVVPVPDKVTLEPHRLSPRYDRAAYDRPTNVDYRRFVAELRGEGIDVFDPTPDPTGFAEPDRFLRQDTHWTPDWMEEVARGLAEHLKERVPLLSIPARSWGSEPREVRRSGDIAEMLRLAGGKGIGSDQRVTIHRIVEPGSGRPWQSRDEADVLLLGDSFSNIYTRPDLGWGEAAGLAPQLALALGRDVDVIARNGSGSTETRRELARRPAPLGGKAVVVWEFAARELMLAHWTVVPMPEPGTSAGGRAASDPSTGAATAHTAGPIVVEATVVAGSRVPEPFAVPYKDCLTYVKLHVDRIIEGDYRDGELLAVFWGMKNNVRQAAADYGAGKKLRLELVPLSKAGEDLSSARSADDLDDFDHVPYYVRKEAAR